MNLFIITHIPNHVGNTHFIDFHHSDDIDIKYENVIEGYKDCLSFSMFIYNTEWTTIQVTINQILLSIL